MFDKLKTSPVTTVLGLASGALAWLSQQPLLDQHPSLKQLAQLAFAGAVAAFGAFAADAKKQQ